MTQRSSEAVRSAPALQSEWWRGAVIYQIYPRSFRDSNGDGVGDLRGIVEGLDHIASLGVDAIWISPFFTSPMDDFGYDVSDYYGIDPIFGDFDDFDRVVEKAHGLGLKVIIDQVYSHTSDQHAWFQQSRADRNNHRADWYVWADAKPDGSPPSNWQSVFGGSAWQWDGPRKQYYLHNFLTSQPDLNLHNPEVQDALLDVARFWLDKGVDGFRLDAINFAMHDPALRDNPPSGCALADVTRPFDMQMHRFNQSHSDIPKFLERVRQTTNAYPARFTVAEIGGPEPQSEMKAFTANNQRLDSAYNFDFLYAPALTAALVKKSLRQWPGGDGEGWPSWAFSNHDAPRAVTRWGGDANAGAMSRLMLMLLTSLRGNAFIYQGEELGLPQGEVAYEDLQDPEAIANWPNTLGRDGARTPFPWRAAAPNAGFTAGPTAWLKLDKSHPALSVDVQNADAHSMLNYTRQLISLRQNLPALASGDMELLESPDEIVAFVRTGPAQTVICAFNLSDSSVDWTPELKFGALSTVATQVAVAPTPKTPTTMAPHSSYWAIPAGDA